MNGDQSAYFANFQRGAVLRQHRRFREAAEFLGKAIAADPENPTAYAELALCLNDWQKQARKALGAIDRAISLDPNNAHFVGFKGWILVCQGRYWDALKIAKRAVAIDPQNITALNALTNAYTKLAHWKMAEASARRILALDPNDTAALNLLAQALRLQGKAGETREIVARILALVPDNAFGHMNAGYAALEVGDHLRAKDHFLASLRMDPKFELSRRGLLNALRSRLWLYRWPTQALTSYFRLGPILRGLFFFGVIFTIALSDAVLEWCHAGWGDLFMAFCLCLFVACCILVPLALISGNALLFFDPLGRRVLTFREKAHFCVAAALILFVIAFLLLGCVAAALGY